MSDPWHPSQKSRLDSTALQHKYGGWEFLCFYVVDVLYLHFGHFTSFSPIILTFVTLGFAKIKSGFASQDGHGSGVLFWKVRPLFFG